MKHMKQSGQGRAYQSTRGEGRAIWLRFAGAVAIATAASVLGCGRAHRTAPQPGPEAERQADIDGGRLELYRAAAAVANRDFPDQRGARVVPLIRERDIWVAREVIPLSGSAPTYLTWPEATFGETIVQATYDVAVLEPGTATTDVWRGRRSPRHAYYDADSKRWFVSIEEAVGANAQDAGPGRIHRVKLELLFESGRFRRFEIEFQVVGPVPTLELGGSDRRIVDDVGAWLAQANRGETIAYERTLINPTRRKLRAWLRATEVGPSWLLTSVDQTYYHGAPPQEAHSLRIQQGVFRIASWRSEAEGEEASSRPFEEGRWIGIDLPPGKAVAIQLRAATVDWGRCSWPGPVERAYRWNEMERRCAREYSDVGHGSHVVCQDVPRPREEHRTERWSEHGSRLRTEFRLTLRLADPSLSPQTLETAPDSDWLRTLVDGKLVQAEAGAGAEPIGRGVQGCEFGLL